MVQEPARSAKGTYGEDSPLVRVLGHEGRAKILDVFLGKHYTELTAADVTRLSGIARSTFTRNVEELLELDLIEETGKYDGSQHYKLNKDNPVTKILADTQHKLLEHDEQIINNSSSHRTVSIQRDSHEDEMTESQESLAEKLAHKLADDQSADMPQNGHPA
ncbi:hypothetical protein EFA46_007445 [Halarchaeum sp. CBA1220]|uniref:hypothetical protein n=1 Tax=Halarchaeum sp. CBA1220 TaxID=1853682 RepID=UPI0011CE11F9|nr:hypothetical protein [Halarchaeum sp. CBA1220]QLC34043.1 hypothetical protein EFA46_007445 [Halarchaeum sp. CBA1220]